MKTTEDVRKYAAEQGIAEEEALKKEMESEVEGVRGEGRGGLREGVNSAERGCVADQLQQRCKPDDVLSLKRHSDSDIAAGAFQDLRHSLVCGSNFDA